MTSQANAHDRDELPPEWTNATKETLLRDPSVGGSEDCVDAFLQKVATTIKGKALTSVTKEVALGLLDARYPDASEEELAMSIGVDRSTIYRWKDQTKGMKLDSYLGFRMAARLSLPDLAEREAIFRANTRLLGLIRECFDSAPVPQLQPVDYAFVHFFYCHPKSPHVNPQSEVTTSLLLKLFEDVLDRLDELFPNRPLRPQRGAQLVQTWGTAYAISRVALADQRWDFI